MLKIDSEPKRKFPGFERTLKHKNHKIDDINVQQDITINALKHLKFK